MLKSTPGPWVMFDHPDDDCSVVGIGSPENDSFAGSHTSCYLNPQANAHLIASAPDLLEALEKALLWTDRENDVCEWRGEAECAVSKARGE